MMADDISIRIGIKGRAAETYRKVSRSIQRSNDSLKRSLKAVRRSSADTFKRLTSGAMAVRGALVAVAAYAAGKFIGSIVRAGSEVEDLTIQFKVLLGSVEAAEARMKELEKFAQTTPFQLEEVAKASRLLEVLTKGALSTGVSLRMVGDSAAVAGVRFDELAMWVGRAYDGLQSNRPIGEALMRLQELGMVTGDVRAKIELLQKQAKGAEAWKVLQKQLMGNKGGMEELSKTVTGLTSTFKDQLNAAIRQALDSGIWDGIKNVIEKLVNVMNKALEAGTFTKIGNAIKTVFQNLDLLAASAGILFAVAMPSKILAVGAAFKTFGMSLMAINPVLIAVAATLGIIFNKVVEVREQIKKMQDVTWLSNEGAIEQVKLLRQQFDFHKKNVELLREQNAGGWEPSFKRITEINEKLKSIVGYTFEESAGQMLTTQFLESQENALGRIEQMKKKAAEKVTPPTPPKTVVEQAIEIEPAWLKEANEHLRFAEAQEQLMEELKEAELKRIKDLRDAREKSLAAEKVLRQQQIDIQNRQQAAAISTASAMIGAINSMYTKNKELATLQAGIDTFAAANAAYKAMAGIPVIGPGLGIAAAAAATLHGLGNVKKIQGLRDGGISSGPNSGYTEVLHGTEAIIPLKNGAVPVRLEGGQAGQTVTHNHYYGSGGGGLSGTGMTRQESLYELAEDNRELEALGV